MAKLNELSGVGTITGDSLRAILYADDICLLASNPSDLQALLNVCERWAEDNFMEFAPNKSKVLIVHQRSLAPSKRNPPLFFSR